jgi:hypothetical protein
MRQQLRNLFGILTVALAGPALAQGQSCGTPPPGTLQVLLTPAPDVAPGPGGPFIAGDPTLPPFWDKNLRVDIGFEYIQPYFSSRAVTLTVPVGVGGVLVGDSGNFSHNFAFVPRFGLAYEFSDLGFGVGASAKLLSLSGHDQRTINSVDGSGSLNVQSGVDIAAVNLLEGTKDIYLGDCKCFEDTCLADCSLVATLGARYSHVRQDYSASLTSGTNVGSLTATQSYDGFGLTTSLGSLCPLAGHFFLYSNVRGSILVGPNNRSTTVTVVVPAGATGSAGTVVTEDKTTFIGAAEVELGVAWSKELPPATPAPTHTGSLLWFKAGFVGQLWGDLGLLSATNQPQNFSHSDLLLLGFTVIAGIDF